MIPVIEKDFDEAVRLIQENYVDGKKLAYSSVVKSSILGMLRRSILTPTITTAKSMKNSRPTNARIFGIGASIQNYLLESKPIRS